MTNTETAERNAFDINPDTDVRVLAWAVGSAAGNLATAYRWLEQATGAGTKLTGRYDVLRVFEAMAAEDRTPNRSDVWGTQAAFQAGLRGERIEYRRDPVTVVSAGRMS